MQISKKTPVSTLAILMVAGWFLSTTAQSETGNKNVTSANRPAEKLQYKNFYGNPAPKLTVVFVVDQLRADMFTRQSHLLLPAGTTSNPGGYQFLLKNGAYAPYADHALLQNMTGPGHAAISTGSFPYRNGITVNSWINRETEKPVYCVQDDEFALVNEKGPIKARSGISPKNLSATTLGDELKLAYPDSRVFSVALKDRAAVLMAGRRADGVYWFNDATCEWVSSEFYTGKGKPAPDYVKNFPKVCADRAVRTPVSSTWASDAAKFVIEHHKLGQGPAPDLLMLSISTHDYVAHKHGPDSKEIKDAIRLEDRALSELLKLLSKKIPGGLNSVAFALTADHGGPSFLDQSNSRQKIGQVSGEEYWKRVEGLLTEEFGSRSEKYVLGIEDLQIFLRKPEQKHLDFLKKMLPKEEWIETVIDAKEVWSGRTAIPGQLGQQARMTLGPNSGDLIVLPKPYRYTTSNSYPSEHLTGYVYDRIVPLIIFAPKVQKKILWSDVRIVDLAPTLAALLGILPPSMSEGRVIGEAL